MGGGVVAGASVVTARRVRAASRLHALAIHLLRRLRSEDEAAGLSPARLSALSVLVYGGPRTMGELAEAEQVRPPTMTRLVASLEAEGLVERGADARDGRVVRVVATEAARQVLEAGRARRVDHLAGLLAELEADDLATVERATEVLERLLATD